VAATQAIASLRSGSLEVAPLQSYSYGGRERGFTAAPEAIAKSHV
jgi:hypothetical protein